MAVGRGCCLECCCQALGIQQCVCARDRLGAGLVPGRRQRELGQGLPRIPEFSESRRGVRPLPPGKSSAFSQQWMVLAPGNSILRVLKEPCLSSGWVTDY